MAERNDIIIEGYYSTRLIRGGLLVGVKFWRDSTGIMRVAVDGRTTRRSKDKPDELVLLDPFEVWPYCAGRKITRKEFLFLAQRRDWAVEHAPDHPAANPTEPVDLSKMKPRF